MVQRTTKGARTLGRLIAAGTAAVLLGALVGQGLAVASGSAPTVPDVYVTTAEDTPISGNALTDATDPDGDTLSITSHTQFSAAMGSVGFTTAAGAFTFAPTANASGSGTITFWVSDGTNVVTASLHMTVAPVNDAPVCAGSTSSGAEDALQSGTLACTDIDSASLAYALVDQAAHGSAVVNADGTWTYTPNANFNGSDSFTFKANDSALDSNTATMGVTVTAVNDAPECSTPVTSEAGLGHQQSGTFACTDVDSTTLTYTLVDQAAHGTAAVNADGSWTYTPTSATFHGADSFTFKANDGALDSNIATASITVDADSTPPTVAMPTLSLATARIDESAPIKISWSATDLETGIGSYVVQQKVGAGAWTTIYRGTATSITRSYPFSTALYWRVMATDKAGNPSAWMTTTVHSLGAYQEGSSLVTRSGTWSYVASSGSSGTGYRYTTTYLRYAQLRFGGSQVLYIAPKVSSGGYVTLYIDGIYRGRYSTYRSTSLLGQVIAGAAWRTAGTHTIKIVNAQSGHRTTLDAFIVLR